MRLIDADALIQKRNHAKAYAQDMYVIGQGYVMDAPTIDAAPVVRGEWIEKTYIHEYANEETEERQYVVCGICGKQPPSGFGAVNFCPNCGAKMEDTP